MGDFEEIHLVDNSENNETLDATLLNTGGLYENNTIVKFRNSEEIPQPEKFIDDIYVSGSIHEEKLVFTVNKSLRIFKNKECTELLFNAVLDAVIDTYCIFQNYILIALRNGTVHFIDLNCNIVIQTVEVCTTSDNEITFLNCFQAHTEEANKFTFLLVSRNGTVYKLHLQPKINEDEFDASQECFYEFKFNLNACAFKDPCLMVCHKNKITLLDIENKTVDGTEFKSKEEIVGCCVFGYKFLVIDSEGLMFKVSPNLTKKRILFNRYKSIRVVPGKGSHKFIGVSVTSNGNACIEVIAFSGMDYLYSLEIDKNVCLIQPESIHDDVLYFEKKSCNELILRQIFEGDIYRRLDKLIQKNQFEKAEAFAKESGIENFEEILNQAKINYIIQKDEYISSQDVDNLIKYLELVQNDELKLNTCRHLRLDAKLNNGNDVKKIFQYFLNIFSGSKKKEYDEEIFEITELLYKFDTYMATHIDYEINSWYQFDNLLETLIDYIKEYKIEEASIICNRLPNLALAQLNDDIVETIINELTKLPQHLYQPFLIIFIPVALSRVKMSLPIFIEWFKKSIYKIEKVKPRKFLKCIEFAELFIKLIQVNNDDMNIITSSEHYNELTILVQALYRIQEIQTKHDIIIPISDYLKGPETVVKFLLNLNMHGEKFEKLIKQFLINFMLEHKLNVDEILHKEIKDLLRFHYQFWCNTIETILNSIGSEEIKLKSILYMMEKTVVPWKDVVRKIATRALEYSHPTVNIIRDLLKKEPQLIILRKPIYNIKINKIISKRDLLFVLKRISFIQKDENQLVEDVFKLCNDVQEKKIVIDFLVDYFVKKGNTERAFQIIDDNKPEIVLELALSVFGRIKEEIDFPYPPRDQYYECIGPTTTRIFNNTHDSNIVEEIVSEKKQLKNVYKLNKLLGTSYTQRDLVMFKSKILDEFLEDMLNMLESNLTINDMLDRFRRIASYLDMSLDDVLIKFCEQNNEFAVLVQAVKLIYEHSDGNCVNLTRAAVFLLRSIGSTSFKYKEETFVNMDQTNAFNVDVDLDEGKSYLDGLNLAQNVALKAYTNSDYENTLSVLKVLRWTKFYLPLVSNIDTTSKFAASPGIATFRAANTIFTNFCKYIAKFGDQDMKFLTENIVSINMSPMELLEEMDLPELLNGMHREGQHFAALNLLRTLYASLNAACGEAKQIYPTLDELISDYCINKILKKDFDTSVVLGVLSYLKPAVASNVILQNISLSKNNPTKLCEYSSIAMYYFSLLHIPYNEKELKCYILSANWWKLKSNLPYKKFMSLSNVDRLKLIIKTNTNLQEISKYCSDFHLDAQPFYILYFKLYLLNWKPKYTIECDITGKRRLKMEEDNLYETSLEIFNAIVDINAVLKMFRDIWKHINFYHYEVFSCILQLPFRNTPNYENMTHVLPFLQNYTRHSAPSNEEREQYYSDFPDAIKISELSEFRLPFTPSLFGPDNWKIISVEVNLDNYKLWFSLISILPDILNIDKICNYVVKNAASNITREDETDEWLFYPKYNDLLNKIDDCIGHMKDLSLASSVMYHIMSYLPNGYDKVIAASSSYKYASKCRELNPNQKDIDFVKIQKRFFIYSTMHILYLYKLNEKKYMDLVSNADDLIDALLNDERIVVQQSINDSLKCPDIIGAINEIGACFNINTDVLKYNFVKDCISNTLNTPDENNSQIMAENVQRAAYICSQSDKDFYQHVLIKMDAESSTSLACKANAIKVLCAISDTKSIENLTDGTQEELLFYINKLILSSKLENFGYNMSVEALDSHNKKELLKSLAQQNLKPEVVQIMALICTTYDMDDIRYWKFILTNAVKLEMYTSLKMYLKSADKYKYSDFYKKAWEKLILNAFTTLSSASPSDKMIDNFLMIQTCPILYSLDLEDILLICLNRNDYSFAAVLLQYLPKEKWEKYINDICENSSSLLKDIDALSLHGIYGIRKVKSILGQYTRL